VSDVSAAMETTLCAGLKPSGARGLSAENVNPDGNHLRQMPIGRFFRAACEFYDVTI
jgi:hypothetical protein